MNAYDIKPFSTLFADVMAYYKADVSKFTQSLFWEALQGFDFEEVRKAFSKHATDPEHGRFAPKVADMVRILQGTHTDRAQLAWGKTLVAMRSVGAYTDVIFDDAATHAAIDDVGGWPKLCRTPLDELGYVQTAFCKSHKAYVGRGTFEYPRLLGGDRSPDAEYERKGLPPPRPAIVGDPALCAKVFEGGGATGKTKISFQSLGSLAALALPVRESDQDPSFHRMGRTP